MGVLSESQYNALSAQVRQGGSAAENALKQLSGNTVQYDKPSSSSSSSSGSTYSPSSSGSSYSTSAPTQTNQSGQTQLPSWMGNMYSQVAGTDYYSTNPNNPNSAKYYSDGTPVPSVSYSNQQTGTTFDGYASPEQFQQLMNNNNSGNFAGNNNLFEAWIKANQLTSNDSIYNKPAPVVAKNPNDLSNKTAYASTRNEYGNPYGGSTDTWQPSNAATKQMYNVNDPAFLAKPAEERKAILAANPALMEQELKRASDVWFANEGNPAAQAAAHAWAEELRAAQQQQQASGSGASQGGGGSGMGSGAIGGGGVGAVIDQNKPTTDLFMGELQKILQQMQNPTANTGMVNQANQQGQAAFDQKQAQYQQLINSLKSGQASDLKNITNQTDASRQVIEDNTFQKWLASRQSVANRGLGSSGAASDADTRSILARQRDLSGLYNTQNDALNKTNRSYSDKLNEALTSLANNNLSQTQAEMFSKLFKEGQGSMSDQLKAITDLLGKQLGYSQLNPADYLKSATNVYESDARTKLGYAKLDQADKQFYDKLGLDKQKLGMEAIQWQAEYGLKASQIFGQDAEGNPTLDARKMVAELALKREANDQQAAHNRVTEQQGWARIDQADNEMTFKLADMKKRAEQFDAQMQNTAYKDQASALKQIMDVESRNMLNARAILKDKKDDPAATEAYNKAAAKIESTQKILTDISKLPKGTLGDTGGSGTYDISDLPDNLGDSYWSNG